MSSYPVFDAHVDTLLCIDSAEDFLEGASTQLDEPRALKGGVEQLVLAICAEAGESPQESMRKGIELYKEILPRSNLSLMLMLEGCQPLFEHGRRDEILPMLSIASLTWNHQNSLGGGILSDAGLTGRGRDLVRRLLEEGIAVDVSHLCDRSRKDLLGMDCRVVATHCNCRRLFDFPRNLPDGDIKRIAELDGVIGITFVPDFLADKAAISNIVDHASHVAEIAGVEHVGFGSDFDGTKMLPNGIGDCTAWGDIFEEMGRRGWHGSEIEMAAGDNWRRVIDEIGGASS